MALSLHIVITVTYLLLSLFCTIPLFEFSFVSVWRMGLDGPRASVHMGNDAEKIFGEPIPYFTCPLSFWIIYTFRGPLAVTSAVCWRCGAWYLGVHILSFADWDVVEFIQCIPNLLKSLSTKCLVTVYDIVKSCTQAGKNSLSTGSRQNVGPESWGNSMRRGEHGVVAVRRPEA
jgi:hypothetical protein